MKTEPAEALRQDSKRSKIVCLLLVLATLAVFSSVRNFQFINFDDPLYVTENPHVQRGLTLDGAAWAFRSGHASNWHPLTWLSHMLDCALFESSPAGPHVVNLIFHSANTVLVFLLLKRLTAAFWRSAFVAALFALHPLHVESVAWISERKDVLSAFFGLSALMAYGSYATHRNYRTYAVCLALFALGLLAKPMLVTLPFVMLLLDYWPLNRVSGFEFRVSSSEIRNPKLETRNLLQLILEKWPFFLLAIGSSIITFLAQKHAGAVSSLDQLSPGARIGNALVSCMRYLGKIFWPFDLAVPYPHPGTWPIALVILAALIVAGLSGAALWSRRKFPFAITGWFWFLGMLLPVIGLVQVGHQSLADRYTYLPAIGVFIVIAWGATEAASRWTRPRPVLIAAASLVLSACALRTLDQLRYWHDSGSLFAHSIAVSKNNYLAHDNLGFFLFTNGRFKDALDHYEAALRIRPGDPNTLNNLGSLFASQKQPADAVRCYEAALRAKPDFPDAHNNLGVALFETGDLNGAFEQYSAALQLAPDFARAHNNLANLLVARGKSGEAIEHYRQALAIDPNFPEALNNLGWLLAARGEFQPARDCYEKALQLNPNDELVHKNLGDTLIRLGRTNEAAAHLTEALRLKPDYPDARRALESLGAASPRP